jgi:hypothetical protein
MRPSYYASVLLQNTTFEDARRAYVEWVVGARRFERARAGREAVGIDTSWSMRALHEGTSFIGRHDARVATRRAADRFLVHLIHRDANETEVLWHSVVELCDEDGQVRIRHAAARSGPPGAFLRPKAGAPNVLRRLLKWNGRAVTPANIGDATVIRVDLESADQAVRHLVLPEERSTALVLVTPRIEDGTYLAPPELLAERLAGMCRVVAASDDHASQAITRSLQDAGFPRQFATMDGGVRVLLPGITSGDSPYAHRLWTRSRIESIQSDHVETLAGDVAETAVRGTIPRGFFQLVDEYDLREAQRQVQRVLIEVPDVSVQRDLASLRVEHATLRAELEKAAARVEELASNMEAVEKAHFDDLVAKEALEQERDEIAEALRKEQAKCLSLQTALGSKSSAGAPEEQNRAALRAVLTATPTPVNCLRSLEMAFGDRVVVLPSAHTSATEASDFRYGTELWRLLQLLATDYFDQMVAGGGGDAVARTVFGGKFAAKESETTMNNARAKAARTFTHNGDRYVMWRHLKHGVADTTVESIRVHFEWLGDQRLLLIGHCGAHLYLPSH